MSGTDPSRKNNITAATTTAAGTRARSAEGAKGATLHRRRNRKCAVLDPREPPTELGAGRGGTGDDSETQAGVFALAPIRHGAREPASKRCDATEASAEEIKQGVHTVDRQLEVRHETGLAGEDREVH